VRVVLTILAACLVAGCGAAGPTGAPTPSNPGLLVFGGVVVPVPEPPGLSTPWHQPISYYALGPDGTGLRKLAFTARDWELDFSPGGAFAVMSSYAEDWNGIVVSPADGSGRRVVPLPKDSTAGAPAVSADGKTVALAYAPNLDASPMDLWTVSVDGSHLKRLAATGDVLSIAWSPDGKHIAFVDGSRLEDSSSGAVADIYVVDADGSNLRRLARGFTGLGREVAWSPDGARIAFQDASQRVAVIDAEGGMPKVVTQDGEAPAWSPDGTRIAFLRVTDCGRYTACRRSRIVLANIGGRKEHVVGPKFGEPVSLSWIPAASAPSS
jgi:Tol biopolymer transport system component